MTDLDKLWKNVLGDIKLEISQGSFVTLLKPTTLLALDKNTATIAASSTVLINMIKKFEPIIKEALSKHTGKELNLIFIPKTVHVEKPIEKPGTLFIQETAKKTVGHLPRVRSEYTFETLAVSPSNQLAYVSAQN